jgi:outer membrane protein assembly factor BamB
MRHSLLLLLLLPTILHAQKEFPAVWEGRFSVDPQWHTYTDDLGFVLAGDMTEIEMLDGTTGKSLWQYNFKEKLGVKKCQDWTAHHGTETVEVIVEKGKDGATETVHLDYRTGTVVAQEQVAGREKVKTKAPKRTKGPITISQSSCADEASNTSVDLSYDHKKTIGIKNGAELDLTVEATGGHTWTTQFTGRVVGRLTQMYLPADEGDVILTIACGQGKVFVIYEGITCLDLATGKVLWNTTFDNVEVSSGLKVKQEIGRSAKPLVAADGVYICDFTKGERTIKKLDLNTGAVIWKADKLKNDDIVSELVLDAGNLIARFGGLIRVEQFIPAMGSGTSDTYKAEYIFEGSTSLRAFDAATGKPTWNTMAMELPDNFKKSPCNILSGEGRILACGEKNMYVFEAATGNLLKQGEYNAKTIGKARALYPFDDTYMIEGEEGITRLDAGLVQKYATNTDKCLMTELRGNAFIVWTGKDIDDRKEFVRFDPSTGAILGSMSDCYKPRFDSTGDHFLKFNNEKVTLYRTN